MARGNQLVRQWVLLQRLSHAGGLTITDASREMHCSVRTVWRDLTVLQEAGFPLYSDSRADGHRDVWHIESTFLSRLTLPLTLSELVALLMSRQWLAAMSPSTLSPAFASIFEKISAMLGKRARELIDRMADAVGVRASAGKLVEPAAEHLSAIHTAISEQRSLRLRYYSMSRDAESERRVDPYHVTWFNSGFYLVAFCHARNAVRIFAVERIREVELLADRFSRPADFDADRYLRDAWGIIRGDLVTVKAIFSPAVARYVKERRWHPSQEMRDLPGDRLEVTLRVADTLEVRRWLMGYGAEAEVLAPPTLRQALRREVEAMARVLGEDSIDHGLAEASRPVSAEPQRKPTMSASSRLVVRRRAASLRPKEYGGRKRRRR